jgi:tetratricopeptide (TPR) repeat protein
MVPAVLLGMVAGAVRAEEPLPVRIDALMEARRFAEVRPLVERWCEALAGRTGKEAAMAEARARHVLGSVQDRLGEHAVAVATFDRALDLYDQAGAGPVERAAALDEAGRAAQAAGMFVVAEARLRAAVEARADDPSRSAGSRAQLADVVLKLGRFEEAERELAVAWVAAGADPAARWQVARQRGVLEQTLGRPAEAVPWLDRAIEAAGDLGGEAEALVASLNGQRGQVLFRLGWPAEAARALETSADFFRGRPDAADEWLVQENNLATVWLGSGQAVRARDRLRALLESPAAARLGDSPAWITVWLNAGAAEAATGSGARAADALARAARLADDGLPDIHPLRAQVAAARLALAVASGDRGTARREARRASDQARAWLGRLGDSADESQWLEFRRTLDPVSPLAVVGAEEPEALADAVLATQGLGLKRLLGAGRQGVGAGGGRAGWRETVAALPTGAVLVNFVWWRPLGTGGTWSERGHYGALVLRAGGPPVWTDLGPAAAVEARIRRVIQAARDTVAAGRAVRQRASLDFQTAQLWDLVWADLVPHVEGAESIVLRPDGMLQFVPWAILREPGGEGGVSAGRYFCQRYEKVRVVARAEPAVPAVPAVGAAVEEWRLVAVSTAPGVGAPPPPDDGTGGLRPELWREVLDMSALPGVIFEVAAIRAAAPGTVRVALPPPREPVFVRPRPAVAPAVLHFSGHGFAMEQEDEWGVPRLEAGLVFADCADALMARAAGHSVPADRDGILTAREAAGLNLVGTGLVMLSACQSALGQWQPGEHMAGLRHAFLVAGARQVAGTLWDLDDAVAPLLMEAFYRRLGAGAAPAEALWQTQRQWLETPADDPAAQVATAGAWTMEAAGW